MNNNFNILNMKKLNWARKIWLIIKFFGSLDFILQGLVAGIHSDSAILMAFNFADERQKCNYTLREVASKTGLSPSTINRIEKGSMDNPSFLSVLKLTLFYKNFM